TCGGRNEGKYQHEKTRNDLLGSHNYLLMCTLRKSEADNRPISNLIENRRLPCILEFVTELRRRRFHQR
ncbi:MAG TPA: hypothetical protein PLK77_14445, partial [Pyrinomonadaceae bacterium]|nr:hypothetical protein [Pyrinomonadaceae bacterium]